MKKSTTTFSPLESAGPNEVWLHGRKFTHFSGCDYFRLTHNPRLTAAAKKELAATGLNVAASRLTTGDRAVYHRLEAELAKFFHCESAIVLSDGYRSPLALAQAFAGDFTHAFIDELAHGASLDAAQMLGCSVKKFPHRNPSALKKFLVRGGKNFRPVILTDGMFSADGSVAPLHAYLKMLPRSGMIFVDDAHGVGLLGANGRGSLEVENISDGRVIQCGTLSKAFGAFGGFIVGSRAVREKIMARSRSYAGATPLPPPLAGAALASLKILFGNKSRRKKAAVNTIWLRARLRAVGWEVTDTPGPIVRLPILDSAEESCLKKMLLAAGIYPPFLKYGPAKHGTFRFVISSEHRRAHLQKLVTVLENFISVSR